MNLILVLIQHPRLIPNDIYLFHSRVVDDGFNFLSALLVESSFTHFRAILNFLRFEMFST